ncbi:Tetratricopeptide repeat-containing protein [Alkalidesulfovibrio alkalitolerans DSM 16529]|uniref:Tetratricopeptide repeat-containing protein n=1 Tax=Alkalidesulfovibrio alkalitolerans DSM 16529 TaxID=1121439 RepID=S7UM27_9BACT|nr:Tetratricopeptide repeat-containing protein [Alkalidesulfovibrio alkalitolerans DSM 16529]
MELGNTLGLGFLFCGPGRSRSGPGRHRCSPRARFLLGRRLVKHVGRAGWLRLLVALLFAHLLAPALACALTLSHAVSQSTETLVLTFDGPAPEVQAQRVGADRVAVMVSGANMAEQVFEGNLVAGVTPLSGGFTVRLKTSEFGFIRLPARGNEVVIQFFRDPIGARWRPPEASRPAPAAQAAPRAPARPRTPAAPQTPAQAPAAPAASAPAQPSQASSQVLPGTPAEVARPQSGQPASQPPVGQATVVAPGALRAPVSAAGPETAPVYGTSLAEALAQPEIRGSAETPEDASAPFAAPGEVRMPAVRKTLAEILAEAKDVEGRVVEAIEREAEHLYRDAPLAQEIDKGMARLEGVPALPGTVAEVRDPVPAEQTQAEAARAEATEKGVSIDELRMQFDDRLQEGFAAVEAGRGLDAAAIFQTLIDDPAVPNDIKEEALYARAQGLFAQHANDLAANFPVVVGAFERAMNFRPDGPKVPSILMNLGLVNLRVGNVPEATAYFNLLRQRYPDDENVPLTDYYWGRFHFDREDYQRAADHFQNLVQNHPDSPVIREAAVGLADSLSRLGYYDQAFQVIDFVDKRFPRYYVESPEFLRLSGNIANNLERFERARSDYWAFYNLDPTAPEIDVVLARIGDIYLREGKNEAARDVYTHVAENYPDEQGGLVAQMRLAEEGIYDDPSMMQMFSVFDRRFTLRPSEIYTRIVEKYPRSAIAPLAQTKLAMWYYFNNRPDEALDAVEGFFARYPLNPLAERVEEVGVGVFERAAKDAVEQENWPRIAGMWERFPFLARLVERMTPDTRIAVGLAYWRQNRPDQALEMAKPFLTRQKQGVVSEMALNIALDVYVGQSAWADLADLYETVRAWQMPDMLRRQLDFASALALTSLGRPEESEPLWSKLATDRSLSADQRGLALFHLARFAQAANQLEKSFLYAQESLSELVLAGAHKERVKDLMFLLMDVTQRAGRLEDALRWGLEYDKLVTPDEPEWGAFRIRLADVYRDIGDMATWRRIMEDIVARKPGTMAARSARSALQADDLRRQAGEFSAPIL